MRKPDRKLVLGFFAAAFIAVFIFIFASDSTYNAFKSLWVKDAKKYMEMYAYARTKPSATKYFIVQGNEGAQSFFKGQAVGVEENDLEKTCSDTKDFILIYEKDTDTVKGFIEKRKGKSLVLNPGTDIQFYAADMKGAEGTCNAD